jgi:hypothetical protein
MGQKKFVGQSRVGLPLKAYLKLVILKTYLNVFNLKNLM